MRFIITPERKQVLEELIEKSGYLSETEIRAFVRTHEYHRDISDTCLNKYILPQYAKIKLVPPFIERVPYENTTTTDGKIIPPVTIVEITNVLGMPRGYNRRVASHLHGRLDMRTVGQRPHKYYRRRLGAEH